MRHFLLSENTLLVINMILAVAASSSSFVAVSFYRRIRESEKERMLNHKDKLLNEIHTDIKKLLKN